MTRTRISAAAAGAILTAVVLLSGCSASNDSSGTTGAAAPQQADSGATRDEGATDGKGTVPGAGAVQPTVTRAIIKTGSLSVETAMGEVDKQRQGAIAIATALRGQVASEDTGSVVDGNITRANLVIKVPTASYETAIQRLSALGTRTQIHQESSDVTEQVVDVESRITTQRASLDRMRALLAKANTIGEIVSVESELTRREADLESLLAKQKALAGQTELATLNLTLAEKGATPTKESDDRGFLAGLRGGWDAFTTTFFALATALGAVLPFLIAFALIAIPLWRFRHRLRRTEPVPATASASVSAPPSAGQPTHPDRPDQG